MTNGKEEKRTLYGVLFFTPLAGKIILSGEGVSAFRRINKSQEVRFGTSGL